MYESPTTSAKPAAGNPAINGQAAETTGTAAWLPGVMLAEEIDAPPDAAIHDVVDRDAWAAFRAFRRRFGVELTTETTFGELDAVPAHVAHSLGLDEFTRAQVCMFIDNYAYPLADPHDIGEQLEAERTRRFGDRDRAARELQPAKIPGTTLFALAEVARVAGGEVADAALDLIDRDNMRAWEAPRPHSHRERVYLVNAAELVRLGVPGNVIAEMAPATEADHDAAMMKLAKARKLHRDTINTPDDDDGGPLAEAIRHAADMVNDPPTGVIVDGLLYEKTVVHWIGDGGSFKTFTALALACSVATGRDFTHQLRVPERRGALFLCAEHRHHGLSGDIRAWCQHNGITLDPDSLTLYCLDDVVQLANRKRMRELTRYVIEHGIKLIVVDTQSTATVGLDENSATAMGEALANAKLLARKAEAVVIVIHHTTRGQNHARGSTIWRDNTDVTVRQEVTGRRQGELVIDKHKSVPVGTRYPIQMEEVVVTTARDGGSGVDLPGEPFTTLVALPRDPITPDERAEQTRAALDPNDTILVAVVEANDGLPLSPTRVFERARNEYEFSSETARLHLRTLAERGVITEHVSASDRRTYSARATAISSDEGDGTGS